MVRVGVGGAVVQSVLLWTLQPQAPTWRVPIHLHLCLLGTDNLCIGSLQPPRYVSAPLTGAPVWLLTRQWREIPVCQCLTSLRPTHAPAYPSCVFVDSGLIFERPELGARPRLPTDTPNMPSNSHRRCTFIVLGLCTLPFQQQYNVFSFCDSHIHFWS